jgi:hypothetical protein
MDNESSVKIEFLSTELKKCSVDPQLSKSATAVWDKRNPHNITAKLVLSFIYDL